MGRLSFDLNSDALLTRSETLLSMLMREDLKTTTDEAYDETLPMSMRGDLKTTCDKTYHDEKACRWSGSR
jgi:hypothetical protein